MKKRDVSIFPNWLRGAMALVVVVSLSATYSFTQSSDPLAQASDIDRGTAVQSRNLYFHDAEGGRVIVKDANDQSTVAVITIGEDGFMRSVMRGLARQRIASGFDDSEPFELTSWNLGYLSLNDPVTGRFIELTAFGPDNAGAFARLLPKEES